MTSDEKRLPIHRWAADDRPREKMLAKGSNALSDAELLAILIASGNRDESAVELARRILRHCDNNLNRLGQLSIKELCRKFKGIGQAKAISISAALELGRRRNIEQLPERPRMQSSTEIYSFLQYRIGDLPHEEFWVLLLDRSLRLIEARKLSQGGSAETSVDIAQTLRTALEVSAAAIAVAHNHPSGQLRPSEYDRRITRRLQEGCLAIGIQLIDHLIVSSQGYFSFADEEGL